MPRYIIGSSRTKVLMTIFLLTLLLILPAPAISDGSSVEFNWALLSNTEDSGVRSIDFKNKPSVTNDDRLRFYFELIDPLYIYLYIFTSEHDLEPLFPGNLKDYDIAPIQPGHFYTPKNNQRFLVQGEKGTETFHLLVSPKRLLKLEKQTRAYIKDKNDPNRKAELLNGIKTIKREHFQLTSRVQQGESILGIMVNPRTKGNTANQETIVTNHVKTRNFFGKTFSVEHR